MARLVRIGLAKRRAALDRCAVQDVLEALALFADAVAFREANSHTIGTFDDFARGVDEDGGFWIGAWCGDDACEAEISAKTKATIRFLPIEREDPAAACVHCGKAGTEIATWARAY